MTFGPSQYVPILKVKRGEKAALKIIAPLVGTRITPLLEIVERNPEKKETLHKHLDTAFDKLAESLYAYPRCFIDTRELAGDGSIAADEVYKRAAATGIAFTPVTGVTRVHDFRAALNYRAQGIAIRLTRKNFETGRLEALLMSFMGSHGLKPSEVDLIADLGELDKMIPAGAYSLIDGFLSSIPNQPDWRTLTLSGCSFPPSMGAVKKNSWSLVQRLEWISWRDHLFANRKGLKRLPSFGDCAIQHPAGVEGFDPRTMAASAAVRYTLQDRWLLIKGQSTKIQ
ncbi:MAG: hypothetical protein Q8O19_02775, partial [Rectinemataceae bacterium]|nr:hypothetical protein [Rectinemataceae bacterium]